MIIGINIEEGESLEWFSHILGLNISKVYGRSVEVVSLKQKLYKYTQTTLNLDTSPTFCRNTYLPFFNHTIEDHLAFVLESTHTVCPNLFYTSEFESNTIYILLDVITQQDRAYIRSIGGASWNLYRHPDEVDENFDLNVSFNGLKYLTISNYLTDYIHRYEN